ncbi:MAG: VCBS repeat-containing protein [Woeseiaceae bacterium]|nr:VCBS repeat-containing protein [Woeseiaceae bacterium]
MRYLPPIIALLAGAPAMANGPAFEERVIDAGFHIEQPALVGNLVGEDRHIVLAGRDDQHEQRMAIYRVDGPDAPLLTLEPGRHLIAYDLGRIGDRDALYFVEPGRIVRYDIGSGEFEEFIAIRTIYGQKRTGRIVPIDFIQDVNGDARDDIVVPDTAGYRVRLQRADGTLGDEVVLEDSSAMSVADGRVSFESRPLVSGNMTDDELVDLAVWRGDTLLVYEQLDGDRYSGQPLPVPLELGLQSEAEMQNRTQGLGAVDQEGLVDTRILRIEDLNGDSRPDILTESLLNLGVFDKENDFRLHLGRRDGAVIGYFETEDALLASSGLQYGLVTTDLDGDGRKDLFVRKVRMSFGRVIRALLAGNVPLQVHFYRMTDDDTYPEEANYITKTNVRFSMSSGQVDVPAIRVADFDGDGLEDLLMQTDPDRLEYRRGVRNDELFDDDGIEMTIALPRNGELVSVENLDDDGLADLVLRYNESDGDGPSKTIRLLLTR